MLKALANVNRLRLLQALQEPKAYADLNLPPSREDAWGSGARAISRQAIRPHLKALMDIGVVTSAPDAGGVTRYLVDHAKLFGVVEHLRRVADVHPTVELHAPTADLVGRAAAPDVVGPQLALVRGVGEGRAFALRGATAWTIGRSRSAAICLDYDPYVSAEHARVLVRDGRFILKDLPSNRNGTMLTWRPLAAGKAAPLKSGDVVGVGMSLLVMRE